MPKAVIPYHHGALRLALIEATEALLAEKGADGFSLREVARRAGVSPAAPAHHFGDAAGLLTAVATLGFEELTRSLESGVAQGGDDARAALREQGLQYVRFAMRYPGRFRLMFRSGKLHDDPELERHADAAFEVLAQGVRRAFGLADKGQMNSTHWNAVTALWSLVHGFAHLAIAGRFGVLCGPYSLEDFSERSLGPILQASVDGLIPIRPARPARRIKPA